MNPDDLANLKLELSAGDTHAPMVHPSAALLERAATGGADPAEWRRVLDHLSGCRSCRENYLIARAMAATAPELTATLEREALDAHAPQTSARGLWLAGGIGLVLMAAAGLLALVAFL